jgi:hypothetical protein
MTRALLCASLLLTMFIAGCSGTPEPAPQNPSVPNKRFPPSETKNPGK